jgi:hypothetical protein
MEVVVSILALLLLVQCSTIGNCNYVGKMPTESIATYRAQLTSSEAHLGVV